MRAAASATISAKRRLVGRTLELDSHRARSAGRLGRSGDGGRTTNAPSTSAPMSATTRAVASHGDLGGVGRAEPTAVKRDAQIAVARHHGRFGRSLLRRSSGCRQRRRNSRSPADGAEREDGLTRLDVDEDLVAGGRSQSRATLAERIRDAHQSHCVDGVGRERPVRGIGRVQPGERVAGGVRVPPPFAPSASGRSVVRVQARSGAPVLLELDEHRLLQHPSEARRSRHGASRAPSTCCERARARRAPEGRRRPGRGKGRRHRPSRSARRPGRRSPRAGPARRPSRPRTASAPHRSHGRDGRRASDRSSPRRGCRRSRPREP